MAYGIMRTNKQKMSDCRGIQAEANRSPDKPMDFPGSNIDWSKTGDNIYLVKSDNFRKSIKTICAEHGITTIRKDAVAFLDSMFGASPEFFENADRETALSYFDDCLKFAKNHLGVVFNARIHVDEGTWHMTLQSVPIVQNEDGTFSLSAKRLMGNRADYAHRQDLFFKEVSEKYGFDPCEKVEDAVEKRIHYDNIDYKLKMRTEELEKVSADLEVKTDLLEKKTAELETVNQEVKLKTGILETAFEKIGDCCRTIYRYTEYIYRSFIGRISDFLDKIAEKVILSDYDFEKADMKTEEISSNKDRSLVLPVTSAGDRLTWDSHSPIYENNGSEYYVPFGSLDNESGEIELEDHFDWYERFPEDGVDDYMDPAEVDFSGSLNELESLKSKIGEALGKNPDVEIMEDVFDNIDSPTPDQPDNDEIDNDDVGID